MVGHEPQAAQSASGDTTLQTCSDEASDVNRQLNQHHVFCGEQHDDGDIVGFHSRPSGANL